MNHLLPVIFCMEAVDAFVYLLSCLRRAFKINKQIIADKAAPPVRCLLIMAQWNPCGVQPFSKAFLVHGGRTHPFAGKGPPAPTNTAQVLSFWAHRQTTSLRFLLEPLRPLSGQAPSSEDGSRTPLKAEPWSNRRTAGFYRHACSWSATTPQR